MEFQQLEYFLRVAECLNFTKAAESLYVTQPALSRQIFSLEEELQVQLFERTKRKVMLTAAGEEFQKEAQEIINKRNEMKVRPDYGREGKLRIGYSGMIDEAVMVDILREMASEYPKIDLRLQRFNLGGLAKCLDRDVLDVIITCETYISHLSNIKVEPIQRMFLCAILPEEHPLARQECIECTQLKDIPMLMLERGESPVTHDKMLSYFANCGFVPGKVLYFKDPQTMVLSAVARKGVAILLSPDPVVERYHLKAVKMVFSTQGIIEDTLSAVYGAGNTNPLIEPLIRTIRSLADRYSQRANDAFLV